jgi:hypothetical protein
MRTPDLALALVAALGLTACGTKEESPPPTGTAPAGTTPAAAPATASSGAIPMPTAPEAAAHDHEARHGGTVLELGEHEGHLEVVHDEATGTLTAYVSDAEMKPVASEAPVVNLVKGAVQITMTPLSGAGPKADAWKATHDGLKVEPLEGRVRLKIGDRTYQAPLEHEHK